MSFLGSFLGGVRVGVEVGVGVEGTRDSISVKRGQGTQGTMWFNTTQVRFSLALYIYCWLENFIHSSHSGAQEDGGCVGNDH